MENFQSDFISVINSVLLIVDYQQKKFEGIISGNRTDIKNSIVSSAKAASVMNVPVVLTSLDKPEDGEYISEITSIFPGINIILRDPACANAFRDNTVREGIRKYGRDKLIIAGIYTSENFAETAIGAVKEGYDVFGLIDGCGDISTDKQNFGVHLLLKSGVTPITWMSLASEWMNGWVEPAETELTEEKYSVMLSYLSKR
jgi:nicotinamidase-related amidase